MEADEPRGPAETGSFMQRLFGFGRRASTSAAADSRERTEIPAVCEKCRLSGVVLLSLITPGSGQH